MSGEHLPMDRFADNAKAALQNPVQRQALHKAAGLFRERRTGALQRADGFQNWRDDARAIKDHTLLHLDRYLVQFEQNATARGTVRIFWSFSTAMARRIRSPTPRIFRARSAGPS